MKPDRDNQLSGAKVIVGVCGGISAYKVCHVVSALVQRGVEVQVAMTEAATRFVGPVTFQALSGRSVFTSMWPQDGYTGQQHIQLTEEANLFLVAPATANIMAKAAHGIADDLVSTMILSTDCPILLAPTMNSRMWTNPIVQENITKLKSRGFLFVGPADGWLACRTVGPGRMADPEEILASVTTQLKQNRAQ